MRRNLAVRDNLVTENVSYLIIVRAEKESYIERESCGVILLSLFPPLINCTLTKLSSHMKVQTFEIKLAHKKETTPGAV